GLAGEQTRTADAIAADVHEPAAVERRVESHVRRVGQREAEHSPDQAQAPDRPSVDELLESRRLRIVAVHERLHQEAAGLVGGVEGALDLLRVTAEGFLAEDVLPRL